MTCQHCDFLKEKDWIVFETENVAVMLHKAPAMPGHLLVLPKEHFTIIEQTPDKIIRELSTVSNKSSTTVLNVLKAGGTNIIVENGTGAQQQVPHISFNVIPRIDGDGLNFQWQPKKLSDEQMELIELQLKEQGENIGIEEEAVEPIKLDNFDEKKPGKKAVKKDDYLSKQLRRTP
jgi:histidine triad (HIT) family protein